MLLLCNSCMDLKEPEAVSAGLTETSDGYALLCTI